jgi:hypothetical protein
MLFVITYLGGAGLLAAWIDLHLSDRRPANWRAIGITAAASMLIDSNIGAVLHRVAPLIAVMVLGLGALVFSLLVCLWMLRMLRSAMPA